MTADYLHTRIWVSDGTEEKACRWHLLVHRDPGTRKVSHYCLSNSPLGTPRQELTLVQAQRFLIEHSFQEAKPVLSLSKGANATLPITRDVAGMWHHHMALGDADYAISGQTEECGGANNGRFCHSTIGSPPWRISSHVGSSAPPKTWRALSASATAYGNRPRILTPDALKWRGNESDKVKLRFPCLQF